MGEVEAGCVKILLYILTFYIACPAGSYVIDRAYYMVVHVASNHMIIESYLQAYLWPCITMTRVSTL